MNNRDLIASNLREAIEQLREIASEMESNSAYSEEEFQIGLEHAYHHLNYAWHIRNALKDEAVHCSEENFIKWSKFPVNEISEYE